ncbi:MAG TPA: SIS domain-containing protein [Stellaceae bacterium]|nr:SIS domain-containing protein [Stellaceae bacterium]
MTNAPETVADDARIDQVRAIFRRSIVVKEKLIADHAQTVVRIADLCARSIRNGGKIMLCGNGGSAADAQHLAAELLVRLRSEVNREALPALALALDPSSITACGNDYSFDVYYERMVRGLGRSGDVLIGITTSGKSKNVLLALKAAGEMGIHRVGLLGGDGGPALALCDLALTVPSKETGRIQESHIMIGHAVMELIEDAIVGHSAGRA